MERNQFIEITYVDGLETLIETLNKNLITKVEISRHKEGGTDISYNVKDHFSIEESYESFVSRLGTDRVQAKAK